MDFLTSDTFITVISVVVSVAGLLLALRADIGKRIDRVERRLGQRIDWVEDGLGKRIDRVEDGLGKRIDRVEDGLGKRIDRVEGRARADHQQLVAEVGEVKTAVNEVLTAVTAVSNKLDERSSPRALMVQESHQDYPVHDQPDDSSEVPEDSPKDTTGGDGEVRQTGAE